MQISLECIMCVRAFNFYSTQTSAIHWMISECIWWADNMIWYLFLFMQTYMYIFAMVLIFFSWAFFRAFLSFLNFKLFFPVFVACFVFVVFPIMNFLFIHHCLFNMVFHSLCRFISCVISFHLLFLSCFSLPPSVLFHCDCPPHPD